MKKRRIVAIFLTLTLALGALTACGGDKEAKNQDAEAPAGDDKVIVIGATPSPHEEIILALKDEFEKEGYTLETVSFTDYVQPNKALDDGDLDANYFQHNPYLENFNEQNGTDLVSAFEVHYEPMALFAGTTKSLDDLADGAEVAVPNDTTNEARALLLLQDSGLITLKEDAGIEATKEDIVENPKNLEIVELDAAQLPRTLDDVDLAVINGNYAMAADLSIDDALVKEEKDSLAAQTYANIVAVRKGEEDSEKTQVIKKVMTSDACRDFIAETYKNSVISIF